MEQCFGSFLVGQEVEKENRSSILTVHIQIIGEVMCNLYSVHPASDSHKGFINILSNFLRDESGRKTCNTLP